MSKTEKQTQSEALRLAEMLEKGPRRQGDVRIAAVLRGLDAENKALRSAERTLQRLGYQDRGGQEWAPPIGQAPDFDLIDSLRAHIKALCADAERYQLLRRGQHWSVIDGIGETLRADELDSAIDAKIAAQAAAKIGGAA